MSRRPEGFFGRHLAKSMHAGLIGRVVYLYVDNSEWIKVHGVFTIQREYEDGGCPYEYQLVLLHRQLPLSIKNKIEKIPKVKIGSDVFQIKSREKIIDGKLKYYLTPLKEG